MDLEGREPQQNFLLTCNSNELADLICVHNRPTQKDRRFERKPGRPLAVKLRRTMKRQGLQRTSASRQSFPQKVIECRGLPMSARLLRRGGQR